MIPSYQLVHKPDDDSPCMYSSKSRAEGMVCMCTVTDHWKLDRVEPILVEPTEVDDIIYANDALGGRYKDIPDDVHNHMAEMAANGGIPITTPSQRKLLARKCQTYQGEMKWK